MFLLNCKIIETSWNFSEKVEYTSDPPFRHPQNNNVDFEVTFFSHLFPAQPLISKILANIKIGYLLRCPNVQLAAVGGRRVDIPEPPRLSLAHVQ
jgi:hypothetical protein